MLNKYYFKIKFNDKDTAKIDFEKKLLWDKEQKLWYCNDENIVTKLKNKYKPFKTEIVKTVQKIISFECLVENNNISYDNFINFKRKTIETFMLKVGLPIRILDNFMTENINKSIYEFSYKFLFEKENTEKIDTGILLRLAFIWLYGITEKYILNKVINLFLEGISINDIKDKLSEKLNKDDKIAAYNADNNYVSSRKYCKNNPFLFTYAQSQLMLLELDSKNIKKIYKCKFDNVLQSLKGKMDSNYEQITCFYRWDWKQEFYCFLNNPYAYYSITEDICDKIIISTGRYLDSFSKEKDLGKLSRNVYVHKKAFDCWSALPSNESYKCKIKELTQDYGLILDNDYIYLSHVYYEEVTVADYISDNISLYNEQKTKTDLLDESYTEEQRNAIINSLSYYLTIITGLAGTGKSTVIRGIVSQIINIDKNYIICAYTAKATKRVKSILKEVLKEEELDGNIRTIHSLMGYIRNLREDQKVPDYVIIDEASMVSLSLMSQLFDMFSGENIRVIMLGDINQLPPLSYGNPFEDIINSKAIENIHVLTENFRVKSKNDHIIINSNNIVQQEKYNPISDNNFLIFPYSDDIILEIINRRNITLDNIGQHKFITGTRANCLRLNKIISENIIHGTRKSKEFLFEHKNKKYLLGLTVGDPVIFTKNNAYPGIKNGDEGFISGFAGDDNMIVTIENKKNIKIPIRKNYEGYKIKHVELAYCITIHKSQGSEYDNIYCFFSNYTSDNFLNKNLAYTAITRASGYCVILEEKEGIFRDTCNTKKALRHGYLSKRIAEPQ
jgi:hypothetical protein